jgi:methionine-rich copper-binding protein CopC
MQIYRRIVGAAISAVLFLSGAAPAFAHAELRRATPAVGGTVPTAPAEVLVNFSEPLEAAFSFIVVRDSAGKRVDKADTRVDPTDRTTMRVSLQPLTDGIYIVVWRALTADTHRTEGAFMFRVGER